MVEKDDAQGAESGLERLPPLLATTLSNGNAQGKLEARARRDARMRGVESIEAMREAIKDASRRLPTLAAIPRLGRPDAAGFRRKAAEGLPFLIPGLATRWPLAALTPETLRDRFPALPVRARVGDYVNTAFAPDRAMRDMSMRDYLDLAASGVEGLPPYLGNLELRELNRYCHWPAYFDKPGPPRFWLGPAGTVTPLHADYDDNLFVQIWGSKRIFLAPPHHDAFLYPKEANALLFGSPFDPEAPDYARFPLARQAALLELTVEPGDLLYVPAGWYHQVRSLTFSLSSNRWSRTKPALLQGAAG